MSSKLPSQQQQVIQTHSGLINLVADATQRSELKGKLDEVLNVSANNGWVSLVKAIRKILAGERQLDRLSGLDDEDRIIITAILNGINTPQSLPSQQAAGDPNAAAPGIAQMVYAASNGDSKALTALSIMAEQMSQAGGSMRLLAGIMKKLIDGNRDIDELSQGMDQHGQNLVISIVNELNIMNNIAL
ncbi:MAG: hypothetical protein KAH22_06285 [Thiotrichaceae bacterium]|nr:hypothetical protein [Thiotrichaceae bacterium]